MRAPVVTAAPRPSRGFDAFWRFAAERQQVYLRRLRDIAPDVLTSDPVIAAHRFTNCYRAADRVSQYLIGVVQDDQRWDWSDTFARTMLFKIFNRVSTWSFVVSQAGEPDAEKLFDPAVGAALGYASRLGPVYSAAYLMPPPPGEGPKYARHLALVRSMMRDGAHERIADAATMGDAFDVLRSYGTIGDFLAYQYVTDLNYSSHLAFSENSFTCAGPGARRGLRKCFTDPDGMTEADLIRWTTDRQHSEFERRGLRWDDLWGRDLHLIDIQNLFCETDKYTREAMPELSEHAPGRRIKQRYKPDPAPMTAWFPPKWELNDKIAADAAAQGVGRRPEPADVPTHQPRLLDI